VISIHYGRSALLRVTIPAIVGSLLAAAFALLLYPAHPVLGASFVVTTTADVIDADDGVLSLREAVLALDDVRDGPHTITFDLGAGPHTISLSHGTHLSIASHVLIDAGDAHITIDGSPTGSSIFTVSGHLELTGTNLTLTGVSGGAAISVAVTSDRDEQTFIDESRLILALSHESTGKQLTLAGVTISGNTAGGIAVGPGAVANLTGVTIANNTAESGAGISVDRGTLTVTDSTISSNTATATDNVGGGIRVFASTLTLIGSTVTGNTAASGGGIYASGGADLGGFPAASLTITNSTVSNNEATGPAGSGLGGLGGGIFAHGDVALNITDSTLSGNTAALLGGGLAREHGQVTTVSAATITNTAITGNSAPGWGGGGISSYSVAPEAALTITGGTISNNTAGAAGGGGSFSGRVTITGATIANNTVTAPDEEHGGGGGIYASNLLTIANSSITGNVATGAASGHAIRATSTATVTSNWWGGASGPAAGALSGSSVAFEPFLTADPFAPAPTPSPTPSATPGPDPDPGPAPPSPTPSPTSTPVPQPVVTRVNEVVGAVQPNQSTVVQTQAPNGGTGKATAPAGALPPGGALKKAAVDNVQQLVQQAPPPASAAVVLAFVIEAEDASGNRITSFNEPIELEFTLPASSVPDGATGDTLVLTFWNGTSWTEIEGTVTQNPDGTFTVTASVDHFTFFSVQHHPGRGTFSVAPGPGLTLTTWNGGTYAMLEARLGQGGSAWVMVDGQFRGYHVGAPGFVSVRFRSHFAGSSVPAATPLVVVRRE